MADEKPQKISIGFVGSQVLSGRIVPALGNTVYAVAISNGVASKTPSAMDG